MIRPLLFLLVAALSPAVLRAAPEAIDPRLRDEKFLYEVIRYVYQWYLDDRYFVATGEQDEVEIWIRPIEVRERDAGDESRYAEMWLPAAGLQLRLKLADYSIPELERRVRSPGYRVTRAAPLANPPGSREDYTVLLLPSRQIRSYLFDSRNRPQVPDPALRERLVAAMREVVKLTPPPDPTQPQVFFVSNVSAVSGDLWILWVNTRSAIRFAGELGADQPDLLRHLPLHTQIFDLNEQVVASLIEAGGRNGYMTKDWAGRILFQCIVLGERVEVPPARLGL